MFSKSGNLSSINGLFFFIWIDFSYLGLYIMYVNQIKGVIMMEKKPAYLWTTDDRIEMAAKKKWYKFEYQYTRYNPQLGSYTAKSTVIAKTEKEAEKFAKMSCDKAIYGSNSFDCILSKSEPLELGKDFELEIAYKHDRYGNITGNPFVVARELYHS